MREEEVVLALAVAEEAAAIVFNFNFNFNFSFNNSAPPHLQPKRDMIETAQFLLCGVSAGLDMISNYLSL